MDIRFVRDFILEQDKDTAEKLLEEIEIVERYPLDKLYKAAVVKRIQKDISEIRLKINTVAYRFFILHLQFRTIFISWFYKKATEDTVTSY